MCQQQPGHDLLTSASCHTCNFRSQPLHWEISASLADVTVLPGNFPNPNSKRGEAKPVWAAAIILLSLSQGCSARTVCLPYSWAAHVTVDPALSNSSEWISYIRNVSLFGNFMTVKGGANENEREEGKASKSEFINSVAMWETDFARPKGHEGGVKSSTGSTLRYCVCACVCVGPRWTVLRLLGKKKRVVLLPGKWT